MDYLYTKFDDIKYFNEYSNKVLELNLVNKEYIYNKESLTKAFLFGMKLSGICMQAEGAQGSFYSKELLQLLKLIINLLL